MLRTRLWMGALLIGLVAGMLAVDRHLQPWYPFLLLLLLVLAVAGCVELLHLLPAERRPDRWLCTAGVAALVLANWSRVLGAGDVWLVIAGVFAAVILAAFLLEMARYQGPGDSVVRIALAVWAVGYLGFLTCFFAQLRWLSADVDRNTAALALAIFVPKGCDIGAYFTGRLLGRHPMTPVLSPKKTLEGAAGGLATAAAIAVGVNRLWVPILGGAAAAVGFGLTVGLAGMLGDLAESLVKRDCRQKDASQVVPGFGGVLDVVDAVVFAAPVAYLWLRFVG